MSDPGLAVPVRDNFDYVSTLFQTAAQLGFQPDDLLDMTGADLVTLLALEAKLRWPAKLSTATCARRCDRCGLYDCGYQKCECDKDRFNRRI